MTISTVCTQVCTQRLCKYVFEFLSCVTVHMLFCITRVTIQSLCMYTLDRYTLCTVTSGDCTPCLYVESVRVCKYVHLSVSIPILPYSDCTPVRLSVCLAVRSFICPSICPSARLSLSNCPVLYPSIRPSHDLFS